MAVVEYRTGSLHMTAERPIRIFLNDVAVAVSQGSPYELQELAIGYLLSEGIILNRDCLRDAVVSDDGSQVHVYSAESIDGPYSPLCRVTSSGCAQSAVLKDILYDKEAKVVSSAVQFSADDLLVQMDELCHSSPHRNGGECVHGCGLGMQDGSSLMIIREDIGRHNAMDKLIGQAWLDNVSICDKAMFITGRISVEMVLKAYRAGCPVLVSRKSATDEAACRAEKLGITLVSHCHDGALQVLSCFDRIV